MAIASLVLHAGACPRELIQALRAWPGILDVQEVTPDKLAAVLECPSETLPTCLRQLRDMRGIVNLELVFVNYEDDLETNGQIKSPPLAELRKK